MMFPPVLRDANSVRHTSLYFVSQIGLHTAKYSLCVTGVQTGLHTVYGHSL